MKQSEMKAKIEAETKARQEYVQPPQVYTTIKCKNKKPSLCCWYCDECGRSGCDNIYWLRPNIDTWNIVECDLKEE